MGNCNAKNANKNRHYLMTVVKMHPCLFHTFSANFLIKTEYILHLNAIGLKFSLYNASISLVSSRRLKIVQGLIVIVFQLEKVKGGLIEKERNAHFEAPHHLLQSSCVGML